MSSGLLWRMLSVMRMSACTVLFTLCGVMPCSLLYASCKARRRLVSLMARSMLSVSTSP